MAKQTSSGEARTPLIVALVVCVLLMITFGVLAYMFNSDLAQAREAEKTANGKAKDATDQLAREREAKLIYKGALGILTDTDRTDLQGMRFKEDARKVHADMIAAIDARTKAAITATAGQFVAGGARPSLTGAQLFSWDFPTGGDLAPAPNRSLIDVAVTNYSQRQLAENKFIVEADGLKQAQNTLQALSVKLEETQKRFESQTQAIPDEIAKGIQEVRNQFEQFKGAFNKLTAEQREHLEKRTEEINEKTLENKRAREKGDRLESQNEALQEALYARIDPFQFDKPQGRIIRRTNGLVEIDLGSADNLRPGLTFSVMPSDTPQRGFERRMRSVRMPDGQLARRIVPKGSIEVIEILGPNLAQARITEEESQVRDRVLTGDLLYNAVWKRGASEHIALYGIFDTDADGRDDIKALRDDLAKMGVVVDAYYDLSTMKWVGNITSRTTFAVEGLTPTVSTADGHAEGKAKLISAIADARKFVKESGIRILRPRDFFPRIGYKVRLDVPESVVNTAATFYLRTLPQSEGGDGEVPAKNGK